MIKEKNRRKDMWWSVETGAILKADEEVRRGHDETVRNPEIPAGHITTKDLQHNTLVVFL